MKQNIRQSGSALFVILIAIALFAALSYTFMQNSRTSSSELTDHQAKMAAQEIIAYGNTIADTVQKMKLRGCSDTQLDFSNTTWKLANGNVKFPAGHNPNAPATGCGVFKSDEGKANPIILPIEYTNGMALSATNTQHGHGGIMTYPLPDVGNNSEKDLVLVFSRIKPEVCQKVNEILGVTNIGNTLPTYTASSSGEYAGTYSTGTFTDNSGKLNGRTEFCGNNTTMCECWKVLIAR